MMLAILNTHNITGVEMNSFPLYFILRMQHSGKIFIFLAKIKESILERTVLGMENAFIALDFETANGKRTSICSVGMVKVVNNEIVESFYTLVNPFDYFSQTNIEVHGITPEDVIDAPSFEYVFPYMMQFIDKLPVVAHNRF